MKSGYKVNPQLKSAKKQCNSGKVLKSVEGVICLWGWTVVISCHEK